MIFLRKSQPRICCFFLSHVYKASHLVIYSCKCMFYVIIEFSFLFIYKITLTSLRNDRPHDYSLRCWYGIIKNYSPTQPFIMCLYKRNCHKNLFQDKATGNKSVSPHFHHYLHCVPIRVWPTSYFNFFLNTFLNLRCMPKKYQKWHESMSTNMTKYWSGDFSLHIIKFSADFLQPWVSDKMIMLWIFFANVSWLAAPHLPNGPLFKKINTRRFW